MIFKRKRGIILTAWKKVITILFQKDYKVRGGFLMRKRIMTAAVLMAVLVVTALAPCTAFGMEFSDVPITASYYKAVDKLSNDGVIQGRGDGVFAPSDKTTRAEFCAFLARANNYTDTYTAAALPFKDVKTDSWAEGYISYCFSNGYVNGMSTDTFSPNSNITCEQAVKMVVCASGVGDESLSNVGPKWYSGYLNIAKKYNLLDGVDVEVSQPATRAFVAQIVYNSMLISGKDKTPQGSHAVDVGGNKTSVIKTDDSSKTASTKYAPEEIWEPSQEDSIWKYYQYYGEDYEQYMREDENSDNYTTPDSGTGVEDEIISSYIPKGSSDGILIAIDPGHNYNGVDTGATGNGLREQDITYQIAEKLKPVLERNGFSVIMTRNSIKDNVSNESVSASLNRRAEIGNRNGADLFVSIHCNAGGGTGIETYYCTGSDTGKTLASFVQKNVVNEIGLRNRGVKSARYAVLRNTNMPSILLETAFIDTASDAAVLSDPGSQQGYADAIARGICEYMGVEYK